MIRDPSDGSVREPINPHGESPSSRSEKSVRVAEGAIDSGLQIGSSRPGEIERLNKSREWLKNRREGQ